MTYNAFEVVVVPFPFTDVNVSKRRPALILSTLTFNNALQQSVMAMITSQKNAPWPLDITVQDLRKVGLPAPSVVRLKLFTLDHRLVQDTVGRLSAEDEEAVRVNLRKVLPL